MNNRSGKLNTTANRRSVRVIESKIGRYIRGEISADLIHKTNVQLVGRDEHQSQNNHQNAAADSIRSKTRPPFRNMVNVKNTSFLSAVSDMKRLKLNDSKKTATATAVVVQPPLAAGGSGGSSANCNADSTTCDECRGACLCLAEPDVQGVCICDQDVLRKFVPEPGVYVQTLKRKLSDVRSRSVDRQAIYLALSQYDIDATATAAAAVGGTRINDDRNFEIWQCN